MEIRLAACGGFYIGILLFLFRQQTIASQECVRWSSYGYTSPQGDITLKSGSDLIINCSLNPNDQIRNSSNLFWKLDFKEVNASAVLILNDNTAQLRIPNIQKSAFMAYCSWRNATGHTIDICRNKVHVADPPTENVAINCTSYDFQNITCWWNLPPSDGILNTDWEFKQKVYKSYKNCSRPIEGRKNGRSLHGNFCATPTPCFILTGTNNLGKSVSRYTFDHYRNVVLSSPTKLNYNNITANISWDDNSNYKFCTEALINASDYKASIDYKIIIRKKNGNLGEFSELLTRNKFVVLNHLTPFTNYEVEIQCRFVYRGYGNLWSKPARIKLKTAPSVPDMSPLNVVADIMEDSSSRTVILYWTGIPKEYQFGKAFRYSVVTSSFNSEPLVETTTNTYIRLSNLYKNLSYQFKVQAENEIGLSKETSYYFINKSDVNEVADLVFNDVIMEDRNPDDLNYSLSWKVTHNQSYNIALCWCRGNKSNDGMIHCDDSGIHYQEMVSSRDHSYAFKLPNPAPEEHFFGAVALKSTQSPKIVWSPCVIPTSRKPPLPQVNPEKFGPTWVSLSWKQLKCDQKAAHILGYNVSVFHDGKEIADYFVKADSTVYNITDLSPHTVYTFGISTKTFSKESDKKILNVPTPHLPSMSEQNNLTHAVGFTILAVALVGLFLGVSYLLYKRYRKRITELNNIQLPSGFTEKFNQPLFILQPTNPKDPWQTSQCGSLSNGYNYDIVTNYDWSSASSPTGSTVSSHLSSQESGFEVETPPCDIAKPLLDFGNSMDSQESVIAPVTGYCRAIILDPKVLPQLLQQDDASRDVCSKIQTDTSMVCNPLPSSATEPSGHSTQASSYVQVDGLNFLELSKHTKEAEYNKQNATASSAILDTQLDYAHVNTIVAKRSALAPELIKDSRIQLEIPNMLLNSVGSVGYAQLSVAMDQQPSTQDPSDELHWCAADKANYTKVALAKDDSQTLQHSLS